MYLQLKLSPGEQSGASPESAAGFKPFIFVSSDRGSLRHLRSTFERSGVSEDFLGALRQFSKTAHRASIDVAAVWPLSEITLPILNRHDSGLIFAAFWHGDIGRTLRELVAGGPTLEQLEIQIEGLNIPATELSALRIQAKAVDEMLGAVTDPAFPPAVRSRMQRELTNQHMIRRVDSPSEDSLSRIKVAVADKLLQTAVIAGSLQDAILAAKPALDLSRHLGGPLIEPEKISAELAADAAQAFELVTAPKALPEDYEAFVTVFSKKQPVSDREYEALLYVVALQPEAARISALFTPRHLGPNHGRFAEFINRLLDFPVESSMAEAGLKFLMECDAERYRPTLQRYLAFAINPSPDRPVPYVGDSAIFAGLLSGNFSESVRDSITQGFLNAVEASLGPNDPYGPSRRAIELFLMVYRSGDERMDGISQSIADGLARANQSPPLPLVEAWERFGTLDLLPKLRGIREGLQGPRDKKKDLNQKIREAERTIRRRYGRRWYHA